MLQNFDPDILNQIREGNRKAINKVKGPLKGIAIKQLKYFGIKHIGLADEIVNDVFSEIAFRKGSFTSQSNPMAYLATLSKCLICRHIRDNHRITYSLDDKAAFTEVNPIQDLSIPIWELQQTIDLCMNMLNKQERLLMEGVLDENPVEELKVKLGYKNREVLYTRKSRVLSKFRNLLRKNDIDL
jgi:DNA-directed RNA polymerase specialized sigma24 family protein